MFLQSAYLPRSQLDEKLLSLVFRIYTVMPLRPNLNVERSQSFYNCKNVENLIHMNICVIQRIFFSFFPPFFPPFDGCIESYFHYKNATHIKPYFLNQPVGQGSKPWSWVTTWWVGRHPLSPLSAGRFHFKLHHCGGNFNAVPD